MNASDGYGTAPETAERFWARLKAFATRSSQDEDDLRWTLPGLEYLIGLKGRTRHHGPRLRALRARVLERIRRKDASTGT